MLSFDIFSVEDLAGRFAQQAKFIEALEKLVPEFYKEVGQNLKPWQKPAPKIKSDKNTVDDVSVEAISEQSDGSVDM